VLARCGKLLVVTALVLATGLHWIGLQTVAWSTMLANNLRGDSFSQAVGKTFDGRHPCCLCRAIAAAKKSEKKSAAISFNLKIEFPPVTGKIVLVSPARFEILPEPDAFAAAFGFKPPAPPPRVCFA